MVVAQCSNIIMEYEHEVGEEDDVWNFAESGLSIVSIAPVLVAAVKQDDNVKDKDNDDAVAIANSGRSKSSGRTRIDMMMTENDNDNQNSRGSGNGCAGVVNLSAEYSFSTKGGGGGTSDNNHRLKKMNKQESQSHRPAREMEDSRHCNSSSLMRPTRLVRRTTYPYSPSLQWSTTSSRFLMLACTVFLISTVAEASNYSTRNNITNNNSNQVDDSHQQQSDKPDKLFKDFSVLEDINLIEDLENSADFTGNDNEVDDHHSHLHHNGDKEHYTHQWAVHILGGPEVARRVAEKHGFQFHGEVCKTFLILLHCFLMLFCLNCILL